jgi:hypothetical protein
MQDRYAGDIGDYLKLAIVRALMPGRQVGVGWWLHPDERHNDDGRHVSYLRHPDQWRSLDPDLFDGLLAVVQAGQRSVAALEALGVLPGATYANDPVPTAGPAAARAAARHAWFAGLQAKLEPCDLVFIDPDNGLEPSRFSFRARRAAKSVALAELSLLARPGRALLIYHHQTRRKGGHLAEIEHWTERLKEQFERVDAIRARAFSARVFFLLDGDHDIRARAEALTGRWPGRLSWHPGPDKAREF